ncbi:MAG: tripartite tricarboxylate transporter substrate-binding protein [Pseudolabrys sp.]
MRAFEAKSWFGLVAPAGTPPEVIEKINHDVIKVISNPVCAAVSHRAGLSADNRHA